MGAKASGNTECLDSHTLSIFMCFCQARSFYFLWFFDFSEYLWYHDKNSCRIVSGRGMFHTKFHHTLSYFHVDVLHSFFPAQNLSIFIPQNSFKNMRSRDREKNLLTLMLNKERFPTQKNCNAHIQHKISTWSNHVFHRIWLSRAVKTHLLQIFSVWVNL